MRFRVDDLEFDAYNEEEMHRHHVTRREVRQVYENDSLYLSNKKGHDAPLVMIGRTFGGRLLTVPLGRTAIETIWRPASAWESSPNEVARYLAAGGR